MIDFDFKKFITAKKRNFSAIINSLDIEVNIRHFITPNVEKMILPNVPEFLVHNLIHVINMAA